MKLPEEAIKDGNFSEISKMDEEDEHSTSEFYFPEDLETFDVETETGITESQEAIDGGFYQPTEKCKHKQEDGY